MTGYRFSRNKYSADLKTTRFIKFSHLFSLTSSRNREKAFAGLPVCPRIPLRRKNTEMKTKCFLTSGRIQVLLCSILFPVLFTETADLYGNPPDSAWIVAYATAKNSHKNGLHFAWSIDSNNWHEIGPEHGFLRSDYGNWGTQKMMHSPVIIQDRQNLWHCIWSVNREDGVLAHAASPDLIHWGRQSYPVLTDKGNCLLPEVSYQAGQQNFLITWLTVKDGDTTFYGVTTSDFSRYSPAGALSPEYRLDVRQNTGMSGSEIVGGVHHVAWELISELLQEQEAAAFRQMEEGQNARTDSVLFGSMDPVYAVIKPEINETHALSPLLWGVFFEDINYAADGGLYAELIQNRSFEYDPADKKGTDPDWTAMKAWQVSGNKDAFRIESETPVHPNNKHYATFQGSEGEVRLTNSGFDGIPVKKGNAYHFSLFARAGADSQAKLRILLTDASGKEIAREEIDQISGEWKKYRATLTPKSDAEQGLLVVIPESGTPVSLDMISLFPEDTYRGRENGLRKDLAEVIEALQPRFVRFPGGCIAHGDGIENMYRWKNTVGPTETRKPQRNLWGYHQSFGLGFYEYFLFCEDLGAEPVPVVAAGVPCQNSSTGGAGQQGGIPMHEMDAYIQDVLDLIEFANGDTNTTWGALRASMGHPEPFGMKYIGIGNEDLISDVFEERYRLIIEAVREQYPHITLIGTVGPFAGGADYREGWQLAGELGLPVVDEHYYKPPGWMINNQDFYDQYDRTGSKVYLGEYASWGNTLYNALAEALYMTGLERNGEVVIMSSYAPLLARKGNTQWTTDLVFFDNTSIEPTVNYHVQRLFSNHAGDVYISASISLSDPRHAVEKRIGKSLVYDAEKRELHIRLINLLPVNSHIRLDLGDFGFEPGTTQAFLLSGSPEEKNLSPESMTVHVAPNANFELPAYAMLVVTVTGVQLPANPE